MTIRAVLFDLDGTLLDRRATLRRYLEAQLARHPDLFRPDEAARYVRQRRFPEECVPLPNLHETLEVLGELQVKVGLITNGGSVIQRRKIRGLGLESSFDVIVISREFGVGKPDPRIFSHALRELGESASASVYVGDNPEPDILGAKRAGLHSIWRRDEFWAEPREADHVIDDLAEVPEWIRSFG